MFNHFERNDMSDQLFQVNYSICLSCDFLRYVIVYIHLCVAYACFLGVFISDDIILFKKVPMNMTEISLLKTVILTLIQEMINGLSLIHFLLNLF